MNSTLASVIVCTVASGVASTHCMATPKCDFEVKAQYTHDPGAFTQGLIWVEGVLFESTGQYGRSSIREVEIDTGKVRRRRDLERRFFGEGLSYYNGALYQLTWQNERGFIYDAKDFSVKGGFVYRGQGWGLTQDGQSFILSDGSEHIRFYSFDGFKPKRSIKVTSDDRPVRNLNELEFINGAIWANIWHSPMIAKIDPDTGNTLAWLDVGDLAKQHQNEGVANGLAWDSANNRLLITGKNWPTLYALQSDCF